MKHINEPKLQIIYQEEETQNHWLDFLWEFSLLFVLQTGVLEFLFAWTQMEARTKVFCIGVTGAITFLQVFLHYLTKGNVYSRLFAPCVAVVLLLVKKPLSVYHGVFGVLNYIIGWWNVKHEDAVSLVMQAQITEQDILSFILVSSILLLGLTWRTVRQKAVANTMPIPLLCSVVGLMIDRFSVIGCSLFFIGWVGVWLSRIRTRASLRRTVWLLAISVVLIMVALNNRDSQMDSVKQLKEKMETSVNALRYGTDTLPEGNLAKADQLLDGETDTLRVSTNQVKSLYLRGFVGGRYKNGSWDILPKSAYKGDNSGMLTWLSQSDFAPQNQYAAYIAQSANPLIEENTVSVQNVGANRSYVYAPYSADVISGQGITAEKDNNYISHALFGKKNYTYTEWSGSRPGELLYADAWVTDPGTEEQKIYADTESVYAGFVYANYLDVDPSLADMLQQIFYDSWNEEPNVYYTTERIRDVLKNKMAYKEAPELAPVGAEPISWSLNQGHEGNAVLFASAAVLAYRIQGIPARYVEGYLLPEQQLVDAHSDTVTLTTKNSHAWVEVYLDGVGWIPVDVTPGFYYDTYTLLEMVQKPEKVKHTAAEQESEQDSQKIEDERNQNSDGTSDGSAKRRKIIYLDILIYFLLAIVVVFVGMKLYQVICIVTFEKKYYKMSPEKQTTWTIEKIYRLLALYGYETKPGWNVEQTDAELADRFDDCVLGEYIRIASIIEKHVFGQEALTAAEIRTLYLYAQKLYEVRKKQSMSIRLRCIFSTKYLCGDGDDYR